MYNQIRDLTFIGLDAVRTLVIACDSLGAIGSKSDDVLQADGETVGRLTLRVPLMELIATGAEPLAVINTLCVEMEPAGRVIIAGIRAELQDSGFADLPVTGSTEENMPTKQTGVGITVVGTATYSSLRIHKAVCGHLVYCVGRPKVGAEVLDGTPSADVALLRRLLALPWVSEILPVGSKGVLFEAKELAAGGGHTLVLYMDEGLDIHKSAGPASCVLVSAEPGKLAELQAISGLPVWRVGWLRC